MLSTHAPIRPRRAGALLATTALLAAGVATAVPATASTATTLLAPTHLTGAQMLDQTGLHYLDPASTFEMNFGVSTKLAWSQDALLSATFDPGKVKQGGALGPALDVLRPFDGTLTLTYRLQANMGFLGLTPGVDEEVVTSGPCALKASGPAYVCHLSSDSVSAVGSGLLPGEPVVDLRITTDVEVLPEVLTSLRTASIGSDVVRTGIVGLPAGGLQDDLVVPCATSTGDHIEYALGGLSQKAALSLDTAIAVDFGVVVVPGVVPTLGTVTVPLDGATTTQTLTGTGATWDLGAVVANNIRPVVDVPQGFLGTEGTAIAFGATATGPCAQNSSFVWRYSDGTKAYGGGPLKAFGDSGPFSGSVTATDSTGLTDVSTFSVTVLNAAPVVVASPATAVVPWGRALSLSAQATDPGSGDQSTLSYAWGFGDGTPVATGGPTVTHSWATPGVRDVTVTVKDKDGGATTEHVAVEVTRRGTVLGYDGTHGGTWSAPAALSAALVDDLGNPVAGAAVDFTLDGAPAGSAQTGAAGTATRSAVVGLVPGAHAVAASFAGSPLYTASAAGSSPFAVAKLGTALSWTGAVSGAPNKAAPLSAVLVDALGRPLAGKAVGFVLGTQSAAATTTDTGTAATSMVLSQKPGTYALTASFVPSAADAAYLTGSAVTRSFSLNKK